jgi:hypothetical protein
MNVTFQHPLKSDVFHATVEPDTTGQDCIDGMVSEGFLLPPADMRPYNMILRRTSTQITASATMESSGVVDGDTIAIQQQEQGGAVEAVTGFSQARGSSR